MLGKGMIVIYNVSLIFKVFPSLKCKSSSGAVENFNLQTLISKFEIKSLDA